MLLLAAEPTRWIQLALVSSDQWEARGNSKLWVSVRF